MKNIALALIVAIVLGFSQCEQPGQNTTELKWEIQNLKLELATTQQQLKYANDFIKSLQDQIELLKAQTIDTITIIKTQLDTIFVTKLDTIRDTITVTEIDTIRDTTEVILQDTVIVESIITVTQYDTIKVISVDTVFLASNYEYIEVRPSNIRSDGDSAGLMFLFDNILFVNRDSVGTRWYGEGYPHSFFFQFDTLTRIDRIAINTFGWNEDFNHSFNLFSWGDTVLVDTTKSELLSKHDIEIVTSNLLLEITGGRNGYTDLGEIKLYTKQLIQ
jgi:hypothetical protein